jgi:tRNA modification GTPase
VAIVRVSGDHAVDVVRRVFRPGRVASRPKAWAVESHRAVYGHVYDVDGSVVDEVLVLAMLKPRSYTAEDVVEVHCHGGSICVQRILQLCLRSGAQLAEPGEFTLRAFLNGRLDLLQAEAVNAIIQARTVEAADSALAVLRGGLSSTVDAAQEACVALIAELEARIDFDDEMPPLDLGAMTQTVAHLRQELDAILQAARRGMLMASGIQVRI